MNKFCKSCGRKITVMAFVGTNYCCDDCKKADGIDRSSVGTYMFLTKKEEEQIKESRNGK